MMSACESPCESLLLTGQDWVGADGETHQGCFDLSYLSMMPNMTVLAPKNDRELEEMLEFAYPIRDRLRSVTQEETHIRG